MAGPGRLVVAHYNHALRGSESDADESFVRELARQHGLELIGERASVDLSAARAGEGLEGAARRARYDFFVRAAGRAGARYVATAHTADDQVETVLHHIVRGTGLVGLAGMPRFRQLSAAATLVRPILDATRAEVLAYLSALGQPYREDATNVLLEYTRNRIRHQLLPLLEEFQPHVREALLRLARTAGEADAFLDGKAGELLQRAARPSAGGVALAVSELAGAAPIVGQYALMRLWREQGWPRQDMSAEKWQQLWALATAQAAATVAMFPGGVRAERAGGMLRLSQRAD
jgi:tRNA(Ile)-lysidine synthase